MRRRRVVSAALAVSITALALYFLLTPEILAALATAIATADPVPMVLALGLVLAVQYLRAWRFSALTFGHAGLPPLALVRIALQLNFLNFALPFRLGEFGYPALMRAAFAEPILRSLGILLVARLLDLAAVGAILSALVAWLGLAPSLDWLAALAALALIIVPVGAVIAKGWAARLLSRMGADRPVIAGAAAHLGAISTSAAFASLGLSFALWIVFGIAAALIADAAVSGVAPLVAMLGAAGGNLAFALPINGVLGLGPSQAAFVGLAVPAGAPFPSAVTAALVLHAVVLTSAFLFGGLATAWPARDPARPQPPL
jgi:hypothetical protein